MEQLLKLLNDMSPDAQADFAARCGTSVGYLRKACSVGQRLGEGLCINIERESGRVVTCEELRPEVDWAYLRGTRPDLAAENTKRNQPQALDTPAQAAIKPIAQAPTIEDARGVSHHA